MSYFSKLAYLTKEQVILSDRRQRVLFFEAGDILSLFFRLNYSSFYFKGLCLATKRKNSPNFSFLVFNVLGQVSIEFALLFFANRIFQYRVNDFKRKAFLYNRVKLYYVKSLKNFISV